MATADRQEGLFDRSFDVGRFKHASNAGDADNLLDDSLYEEVSDVDDLQAHHLWVNFLLETWQVFVPSDFYQCHE